MAQTFVTGQRGTDNIAAFRVHFDLSKRILELEPEYQALIVLLNNIYRGGRRRPTKTEKFRWSEFELDDRLDSINNIGGYNTTADELVVSTVDLFYPEALVKNVRTGEVMRVNAVVPNDDEIHVTRGVGPNAAVAINDGDALLIIGGAREEGGTSLPARKRDPVEFENWTQIFADWVEMTDSKRAAGEDTDPHDWPFQQRQVMIEHQKSKELTFWTGAPSADITAGSADHPVRATGGVHHYAVENNVDAGGLLTETEFENFLRPGLRHGRRNSKVLVVSRLIASVLNGFSQGKLDTSVGDTRYGVAINRWLSAHGEVRLVVHDLFDETGYADRAYLLDFESPIAYRYLGPAPGSNAPGKSQDTHIKPNVQENDRRGQKDEVVAECGLQFGLAKRHAVLTGVTG